MKIASENRQRDYFVYHTYKKPRMYPLDAEQWTKNEAAGGSVHRENLQGDHV